MNDLNDLSTLPILQESVIQWQCSDVKLYSYSTLFHTQQFLICTSRVKLHLRLGVHLIILWHYVQWQHKFPAASTLPSHHQHSWLRSLAECSGAAGRCDAFIISAIIFRQHLLQNIYLDIFHKLVTSYVRVMLSNAHVAQFDLEEQMRHCLWGPDTESVCSPSPSPPTGWRAESLHRAADARLR